MSIKQCPKCDDQRSLADGNDPAQCPSCGCYYAKVESAIARQEAEHEQYWKHAKYTIANPKHPGNLKLPPWFTTVFVYLLYLIALWFIWLGVDQGLLEQQISYRPKKRIDGLQEVQQLTDGAAVIIGLCFVSFGLVTALTARVVANRQRRRAEPDED